MTLDQFHDKVLIAALRARGYAVVPDATYPWVRPGEWSRAHGKHANYLTNRIQRTPKPPPFERELGKTGRTIRLRSNPELEAWIKGR